MTPKLPAGKVLNELNSNNLCQPWPWYRMQGRHRRDNHGTGNM